MKELQARQVAYENGIKNGIGKGVNLTLKIGYKVLNEEFGFGDKRLDRVENGILEKLKELENESM